jgi:hypothetical protein
VAVVDESTVIGPFTGCQRQTQNKFGLSNPLVYPRDMVYKCSMDKHQAQIIIDAAGGCMAFARLLGIADTPDARCRVWNWKKRGIPPRVILTHQEKIKRLQRKMSNKAR